MREFHMFAPSRSGHNFIRNSIFKWFPENSILIHNHENKHPSDQATRMNNRDEMGLLVVRDYRNWAASIMKWTLNGNLEGRNCYTVDRGIRPRHVESWWAVAREAYDITNYLHHKVVIEYANFKNSREYRQRICKLLQGEYNEEELHKVPDAGRGSSFDGPLDTEKRYLWWEQHENKEYREIYKKELKRIEQLNTPLKL